MVGLAAELSRDLAEASPTLSFETEALAKKLEPRELSLELGDLVFRDASNLAECGKPGVSGDRILDEVAAKKEAAVALRRYNQKMRTRQRKMEMEASWKATLEYKNMILHMCKKNLAPNVPFVRGLLLSWFEPFRDALCAEQKAIIEKEPFTDRNVYGPCLLQLPPDIVAVVAMHKLMAVLMKDQEHGYVRLLNAASAIGEAVEQETEIYRIMSKKKKKQKHTQGEAAPSPHDVALHMNVEKLIKEQNVRGLGKTVRRAREFKPWGSPLQVKVGSRLIDLLMDVAFIHPSVSLSPTQDPPKLRPALKHERRILTGKKKRFTRQIGVLVCDPLLWSSLEKSAKFVELPYMPMLVEPMKWTSYKKGGYMVLRSHLMRTHGARSQQVTLSRTPKANLRRVFSALDVRLEE
ncbi:hypothetical protein L7F22_012234 [Adiantum nelumboides]|nr:hypothetical protein [Adiantum nelumboides]